MLNIDENLFVEEIVELTNRIKYDEKWTVLRNIILEKNFNLNDILLVSFFEDEEEMEYGVIITREKKVFQYSRSTEKDKNNIDNFNISDITNDSEAKGDYPQIEIAFKMIDDGLL